MTKAIHFWDLILLFGSFDLQTVDPDTNVLAYGWKLQILYLIFFARFPDGRHLFHYSLLKCGRWRVSVQAIGWNSDDKT